MFPFSLPKLLVLVAVIAVVWYGFKYLSRRQVARRTETALRDRAAKRPKAAGRGAPQQGPAAAEDMVQCPVCRAYVQASGAAHCGRADCPY